MLKKTKHLTISACVALLHLILLFIIQFENFVISIKDSHNQIEHFITLFWSMQAENSLFALILIPLTYLALSFSVVKWPIFSLIILTNLYAVINQVGYKLFFSHFQPSMLEAGETLSLSHFITSFTQETDISFAINSVIFLVISVIIFFIFKHANNTSNHLLNQASQRPYIAVPILFLLASFVVLDDTRHSQHDYYNLQHHPLMSLIRHPVTSTNSLAQANKLADNIDLSDLYIPRFATNIDDAALHQTIIDKIVAGKQKLPQPPNIILIVLESVGALQLLMPTGQPNPNHTPNLHQLTQHALTYTSLYTSFPGTVRSMLTLNTGGYNLTVGSVNDEFMYEYTGPSLANTFNAQGYLTGLFSSAKLDFENQHRIYSADRYDMVYDFSQTKTAFQKKHKLHSWGSHELITIEKITQWLSEHQPTKQPFFLQYFTNATHHPYGTPDDHPKLLPAKDRYARYINSLNYTDAAIGQLIAQLKQLNLLDNTLIAITGDHGQAFGKRHKKNHLHKQYLYEENIKSFLILSHPLMFDTPIVSHRMGNMGDILATLTTFVTTDNVNTPGQSLLSNQYTPRIVYFHKSAHPDQWGLIDGHWKFIYTVQTDAAELYDLSVDTLEARNLAQQHPKKIALYKQLSAKWMVDSNQAYTAKLNDYVPIGGRTLTANELLSTGPKLLAFGLKERKQKFIETTDLNANNTIVAWTSWVAYGIDKIIDYQWESPSGKVYTKNFTVRSDWSTTWVNNPAPKPLEGGKWLLSLWDKGRKLIDGSFLVNDNTVFIAGEIKHDNIYYQENPVPLIKTGANSLNQDQCHFDIIAHRGNSYYAPENTLIAIEQGFQQGANLVEVDVRLSKDNIPVLMHDRAIDRTTNGSGKVKHWKVADLLKLDAGSWQDETYTGTKIATLQQAAQLAKGRGSLYLDIKTSHLAYPLKKMLEDHQLPDDIVYPAVNSFKMMEEFHRILPKTPLIWFSKIPKHWDDDWFQQLKSYNVVGIELVWHSIVNDRNVFDFIQQARKNGLAFWTFLVNEPTTVKKLLALGIDGIETDMPGSLREIICNQGDGKGHTLRRMTGLWNFEQGNLASTKVGSKLQLWGLNTLTTKQSLLFGNTKDFMIPAIQSQHANVLSMPAFNPRSGIKMFPNIHPIGPGNSHYINQYTLLMDILRPSSADKSWTAILQTHHKNKNDADLFINREGRLGINEQYFGKFQPNQWYRIAVVVDLHEGDLGKMRLYQDGSPIGEIILDGMDGRWAIESSLNERRTLLFTDNNQETSPLYVNSIQIRNYVMSAKAIKALGLATADGIH